MIAPLAVHVPILITLSLTLRRALELPGSNMATEGFLWLTTLDVPDPIGVLPLLGAVIALSNAETLGRKREQAMEAVAAKTTASSKTPQVRLKQTRPPKPLVAEEPASPARYESPPTVRVTGQSRRLSTASVMAAAHRPIIKTSSRSTSKRTLDEIPAADAPKSGLTDSDRSNLRSLLLTYVLRGMAVLFIPFASIAPAVSPFPLEGIQLTDQGLAMYWVTSLSYTLGQTLVLNRMDRKAVEARKLAGASP
jgi:inner membrane protein COX18